MSPAPELTEKDYLYCVEKGCKFKVAKIASLRPPCPDHADDGREFTDHARKQAIEKGIVSAQKAVKEEKSPKGEPQGGQQIPPVPSGAKVDEKPAI